jgi:hypothetical protein
LLFAHDQRSISSVNAMAPPDQVWADAHGLHIRGWVDAADDVGPKLFRMIQNGTPIRIALRGRIAMFDGERGYSDSPTASRACASS